MSAAKEIETGNKLRDEKKFDEAIEHYNRVLADNPQSSKAYIEKSIALQRLKNFDDALGCLTGAKNIVYSNGPKEAGALVAFRFFTVMMNKGDFQQASRYLNYAAKSGHPQKEIEIWKIQLKSKVKKAGIEDGFNWEQNFDSLKEMPEFEIPRLPEITPSSKIEELKPEPSTKQTSNSTKQDIEQEKRELEQKMLNKDNLYPKTKDLRVDWFQSSNTVTVSIFVKNLPKDDKLKVKYNAESVTIEFPTSGSSEFQYEVGPLHSQIVPNKCSHRVFSTKLELYLTKAHDIKWKELERKHNEEAAGPELNFIVENPSGNTLKYPNSSKKGTDWNKLSIDDDDDEDDGPQDENAFFQKLYKDADDDTRRAMMKSFTESNGTALSTNWDDVGKKNYADKDQVEKNFSEKDD